MRHVVELASSAKVLLIAGVATFDAFDRQYGASIRDVTYIDWPRVGADWQGIIIAPYLWERRFQSWYYSWDCASGVIWDASAIASITLCERAEA
jgi:hypothetical protein